YEAARIVATPNGTAPPYYRIFEIYFDDMQQLQSSLSSPEGQAAPNDIPNFAPRHLIAKLPPAAVSTDSGTSLWAVS
ncbi:MAG: EthD family reductase, partial [Jiangellaceae bacterium]